MEQDRIGAALVRIAEAAQRIDAAAARLQDRDAPSPSSPNSFVPVRAAVSAALEELDLLLAQLQR